MLFVNCQKEGFSRIEQHFNLLNEAIRIMMNDAEKEKLLETVLNLATNGIIIVDEENTIIFANSHAQELLDLPLKDLNNNKLNVIIPTLSLDPCSSKNTANELKIVLNGQKVIVDFINIISEGKITGKIIELNQISKPKNNVLINTNNISLFIQMFKNIPLPLIYVDKNENLQMINQPYAEFLKVKCEEVIGKNIYQVVPNSRIPIVLQTGEPEIAWKHTLVSGHEGIVHRIPIKENGEIVGCFATILFNSIEELYGVVNRIKHLEDELSYFKKELRNIQGAKYACNNIISVSEPMKACKESVKKISKSRSTVLILGESGVGKELFAHALHNASDRNAYPFIKLNCAAIPDHLFESELFGYEEGAFTGAKKGGKVGKLELANGGSLFLDEIGDMPLAMQAKILRVLQEKEFEKIGGKASVPIDVRIVAATNKDLELMVEQGLFRKDLYFRLNILCITVPPLRDRRDDIPILIKHILSELHKELGVFKNISPDVIDILQQYDWPGNVRELRNILEKTIYNSDTEYLTKKDLPIFFQKKIWLNKDNRLYLETTTDSLDTVIAKIEKDTIKHALESTNYNKVKAAEILKIPRPRLYRKMELYGL